MMFAARHPGWTVGLAVVMALSAAGLIGTVLGLQLAPSHTLLAAGWIARLGINVVALSAFAAPFVFLIVGLSEARRVRGLPYFVVTAFGVTLAALALTKVIASVADFVVVAALASVSAYVYWRLAGRFAGRLAARVASVRDGTVEEAIARQYCWSCTLTCAVASLVAYGLVGWAAIYQATPAIWINGSTSGQPSAALAAHLWWYLLLAMVVGTVSAAMMWTLCLQPRSDGQRARRVRLLERQQPAGIERGPQDIAEADRISE